MQVFRYKPVQGRLAPIITMGIKLDEVWYPVGVYVDSGAAYTLLHAAVAQGAGEVFFLCSCWRGGVLFVRGGV